MMNRRNLLQTSLVVPTGLLLARCAGQSIQTVSAQVLADAQGLQAVSQSIISALMAYDPKTMTPDIQAKITAAESALTAALQEVSTSTPAAAAATTLEKVGNALTTVFQAIAVVLPAASLAFPQIAAVVPIYDAAVALLPGIIAYVNMIVTQVSTKPALLGISPQVHAIREQALSPDAARARLGIATR